VPAVRGVNPLLQDVFRRILVNASEAMPDGGEIVIRTSASDTAVLIEFVDPGLGMTPDVQRRVFDPFFTTTGSPTRGLGLPASLGIVQRHEGRIEVESAVGQGTSVRVFLPVESRVSRIVPVDRHRERAEDVATRDA
jgi:signal transduction histidine kinase